jgi:hypothetical protein
MRLDQHREEDAPAKTEADPQPASATALPVARPITRSQYYAVDKEGREFHRRQGPFWRQPEWYVDRERLLNAWARNEEVPEHLRDKEREWLAAFPSRLKWHDFVALERSDRVRKERSRIDDHLSAYAGKSKNMHDLGLAYPYGWIDVHRLVHSKLFGDGWSKSPSNIPEDEAVTFLRTAATVDKAKLDDMIRAAADELNAKSMAGPPRIKVSSKRDGKPARRYGNEEE